MGLVRGWMSVLVSWIHSSGQRDSHSSFQLAQTRLPLFLLVSVNPNRDCRETLLLHLRVTKPFAVSRLLLKPIVHFDLFCLTRRLLGLCSVLVCLFCCPAAWPDGILQLAVLHSRSLRACPDVSTSRYLNRDLLVGTYFLVFGRLLSKE
jgi:hypothetical protein